MTMKRIAKEYWPTGVFILIILFVYCLNFKNLYCLAVFNDEFGYWGNAAVIAGIDWKTLLARTPYYSLGYSLLLVPLFMLGLHPSTMYRLAILMNMGFVCISYFCALHISGNLFPNIDKKFRQMICTISVASCEVLFHSQIAWSESFLIMLMWIMVALICKIERRWDNCTPLLIFVVIVIMYLTHKRVILLIPLMLGILLVICIKNKKNIYICFLIILSILCLIGYRILHKWQISSIYSSSTASNRNNLEVSTSLISGYFFSLFLDFRDRIVSFLCKLGVLFLASFFTLPIIITKYIEELKKKEYSFMGTKTIVILSGVIMLILTSMQAYGLARKDMVVYSRYLDFTIPGLTMVGLCELIASKEKYRNVYLVSIISAIPLFFLSVYNIYLSESQFNVLCSPLWGSILKKYNRDELIAGAVLIEITILFLVCVSRNKKRKTDCHIYTLLIVFTIAQLYTYHSCNKDTVEMRQYDVERIDSIYQIVDEDSDSMIYCLLPPIDLQQSQDFHIKELQFLIYNRPVTVLEEGTYNDMEIQDNSYIITIDEISDIRFRQHCEFVCSRLYHRLYKYHSDIYIDTEHMYTFVENTIGRS